MALLKENQILREYWVTGLAVGGDKVVGCGWVLLAVALRAESDRVQKKDLDFLAVLVVVEVQKTGSI